jgi:hypothetical protein
MAGRVKQPPVPMDVFCVVDSQPVPHDRVKRGSVTCSPQCAKKRRKQQMQLMEQTECKYCRRPATPKERARYKRWRAAENDMAAATEVTQENTLEVAREITQRVLHRVTGKTHPRRGELCEILTRGIGGPVSIQVRYESDGTTEVMSRSLLRIAPETEPNRAEK